MPVNDSGEVPPRRRTVLARAAATVLDLLVPSRCVSCRAPRRSVGGGGACHACWSRLPRLATERACPCCGLSLRETSCVSCRKTPLNVDRGAALALYEPPVPRLVGALKFRGYDSLASRATLEMARFARESSLASAMEAVTWIPSTRERNRKRGFDPAELLAAGLARRLRLPLLATLERTRPVAPQSTLPAARRRVNMDGVFAPRRLSFGRSLLLVDDVVTTGATVAAAAKALRDAGARRIHLLAFARTPEPEAA